MKQWDIDICSGYSIHIIDYEMGDYLYRITVPMTMTQNLGPESTYEPVNQQLYDCVCRVMEPLMPWRQTVPGGWEVRDRGELDACIEMLKREVKKF